MRYEFKLGIGFLLSSKWQAVFITTAIAFGVAVQLFISATVTSLQAFIIEKTLGNAAHVQISTGDSRDKYGYSPSNNFIYGNYILDRDKIPNYIEISNSIKKIDGVKNVSYSIEGNANYVRGLRTAGILVKGVNFEESDKIFKISKGIVSGSQNFDSQSILVGSRFALEHSVNTGDSIDIIFPNGKQGRFLIKGIFELSTRSQNEMWIIMDFNRAQKLLNKEGYANKIDVQVDDVFKADNAENEIKKRFLDLKVLSWTKDGKDLLTALRSQTATNVIIQVVVVLATMMSTMSILLITVLRKSKDIGILKSMGAQNKEVASIFIIQGILYGFIGSIIGVCFAYIIILLEKIFITSMVFHITILPWKIFSTIILMTIVGGISSIIPAIKSSKLSPIEVIREN